MTKYGSQILDIVVRSKEHPTAEQIFLAMKQHNPRIAQGTVYSHLHALTAEGQIRRLSEPGAPDRFDSPARHDHLVCSRCGALTDVFLADLTRAIEQQLGQPILSYDLRIRHLCPACRKAEEDEPKSIQ